MIWVSECVFVSNLFAAFIYTYNFLKTLFFKKKIKYKYILAHFKKN